MTGGYCRGCQEGGQKERAFERLMKADGAIQDEYIQFEKAMQKRIETVGKEESKAGVDYAGLKKGFHEIEQVHS